MATELFASNLAVTTVTSGGIGAPAQGTQETWTVASSAMFGAAATGVSQFHVTDPNAPTEMIAVTNVAGTTWTVTRGAESTTPVSHTGGFTVYQVTTAGLLALLATLGVPAFNVKAFGATGNGTYAYDGATTATSAVLTSSALVPFTGSRTAWVPNAGTGGTLLVTTITCTVAGTATMAVASQHTQSNLPICWGTDDSAAILAAFAAAQPSAGLVAFPTGHYLTSQPLVAPLTNTGSGNVPQAAISLAGPGGSGQIGDLAQNDGQSAAEIIALPTFPQGKFLIDYQQVGTTYGPAGAVVSGLTLVCRGFAAGFRMQGPREFRVKDLSIITPALPVSPGDGATGGFNVTSISGGTSAGAYNRVDHVTVWGSAGDSFYDNADFEVMYFDCHSGLPAAANYHLGSASVSSSFFGCHINGGVYGFDLEHNATAIVVGAQCFGAPVLTKNAVRLHSGISSLTYNGSPPLFASCKFIIDPASGVSAQDGSFVRYYNDGWNAYYATAVFEGCFFGQGISNYATYWVYADSGLTGQGAGLLFRDCVFKGAMATGLYDDNSKIIQFRNCPGITPLGTLSVPVPASGSAVGPFPVDTAFYVTTGGGTATMTLSSGPAITVPATALASIAVPGGQTVTPVYGSAPTWVVAGN